MGFSINEVLNRKIFLSKPSKKKVSEKNHEIRELIMSKKIDKELGVDKLITRRDFVYGSSLFIGGAFASGSNVSHAKTNSRYDYSFDVGADWYGPGGVGDYASSHGNNPELIKAAHKIRSGTYESELSEAMDTGEEFDLIVVGGGFSGLSAAYHFNRINPSSRVLIIDNHPIFGGEAKRNDFIVDGYHVSGPQGSNDFALPTSVGGPDDYFSALNMPREFEYQKPEGAASEMRIPIDNFDYMTWYENNYDCGHFFARANKPWVKDVWNSGLNSTPWSEDLKQAFTRVRAINISENKKHNNDQWLDSITLKSYYENVLGMPPKVTSFYDPIMASIIGFGCDALSAYWGKYFEMPGFINTDQIEAPHLQSFPGGNTGIARHFIKKLIPNAIKGNTFEDILFNQVDFSQLDKEVNPIRMRLSSTAVSVQHTGKGSDNEGVQVIYNNKNKLYRIKSKTAVMASGGWVNRRILKDLPRKYHEAYNKLNHSPVLVANVALTNWRFLERLGIAAAFWTEGIGFTSNIRRPMIVGGKSQPLDPDKPIVMTFYIPIIKPGLNPREQGAMCRAELLSTSFLSYERQIREQMTLMFSAGGFEPTRDIAGIILNRWGHAYVNPGLNFMHTRDGSETPSDILRQSYGRIAIGHSELRGHQYWNGAAGEGRRAVESLIDRYF